MAEESLSFFELEMYNKGEIERYSSFIDRAVKFSKEQMFSNVRYMTALGYSFNESKSRDKYMFVGGLGVLGNLVDCLGEDSILSFRNYHDIDMVVRSKDYVYLLN